MDRKYIIIGIVIALGGLGFWYWRRNKNKLSLITEFSDTGIIPDTSASYSAIWPIKLGSGYNNEAERIIVKRIQQKLNETSEFSLQVDGYFGPLTLDALEMTYGMSAVTKNEYTTIFQ